MERRILRRAAVLVIATGISLGVSLPIPAQEIEAQQEVSTAIVPVIGSVRGWGDVQWRADVRISNPWGSAVDVVITAPALPGDPFLFFTLQPKESLPLPDVAREAFDMDSALTPLVVQTLGTRSVSIDAVIHGQGPKGAVQPQVPRTLYSTPSSGMVFLPGLRIDEKYRTNIGIVNLSDSSMMATLSIQRISGRPLETTVIDVPPRSLSQRPLESLFPTVVQGSDLTLVVEFSGTEAYAYASVLENETHNGRFLGP